MAQAQTSLVPNNFKDLLQKDPLTIKLTAALAALEVYVLDRKEREKLATQYKDMAIDDKSIEKNVVVKVLGVDEMMQLLMDLWSRLDGEKTHRHMQALDTFFLDLDEDGSGTIDFAEWQALLKKSSGSLEQLVTLFDEGLLLSTEEMGEEMHVMTHDAFVTVALEHNLLPPDENKPMLARPLLLHSTGGGVKVQVEDGQAGSKKRIEGPKSRMMRRTTIGRKEIHEYEAKYACATFELKADRFGRSPSIDHVAPNGRRRPCADTGRAMRRRRKRPSRRTSLPPSRKRYTTTFCSSTLTIPSSMRSYRTCRSAR